MSEQSGLEVTPHDVKRHLDEGTAQLVDVREAYEWDAGHIPGDVRHIELSDVAASAGTIDRDRPVVFHCRVGARSLMAAQAFRRAGYEAYSMAGGLEAWQQAGLPLDPPDGRVAPH